MDACRDKESMDKWNSDHTLGKRPVLEKSATSLKETKNHQREHIAQKDSRRAFDRSKHVLAADFLRELDQTLTGGKIEELTRSTGGVKIEWSKKLNTTAGRANWKREAVRAKEGDCDGDLVKHRHHAAIELAEKVIDDEGRLLNVIAHEFCHLTNFMISGVTQNPHGKEFSAWARKCSILFGHRGIKVTTKHTYDIDFNPTLDSGKNPEKDNIEETVDGLAGLTLQDA
ncbi:hypothetical protein NKR23_g4757 [Pleurostoma richardsiae]|uniref:SprT-like domain-containing protein n=1 Tax=Pleurostoma richardsiae TaxID=41990 RepID=A0AA38S0V0_9PEZI|nr:hypothetical protein NKR23_g4757 [Pleurostoma richardsiae]